MPTGRIASYIPIIDGGSEESTSTEHLKCWRGRKIEIIILDGILLGFDGSGIFLLVITIIDKELIV